MVSPLPVLLSLAALASSPLQQEHELRLLGVERIWDRAPHSAFTDLAVFEDHLVCVFRIGRGHVSADGRIQVLRSADGEHWVDGPTVGLAGHDLRDPHLAPTAGGRLLMIAGAAPRREDGERAPTGAVVCSSADGVVWSEPTFVADPGRWLWRVASDGEALAGFSYDAGDGRGLRWHREAGDGSFPVRVGALNAPAGLNEVAPVFHEGRWYALARRVGGTACFGITDRDGETWRWHDLDRRVGGPALFHLGGFGWLGAGRLYDDPLRTGVFRIHLEPEPRMELLFDLPSGGDTSYPGFAWWGNQLFLSYYSSHTGRTAIHLARLGLSAAAPDPGTGAVGGLREGERAWEVAQLADFGSRSVVHSWETGRVVHGVTGLPVEGVQVEALTEAHGLVLDETRTAEDGSFRVRRRDGWITADRLRYSRPGFCTFVESSGGNIELHPRTGFAARIVDLVGRPIPGAVLRTRSLCAHDPPGVKVHADLRGHVDLPDHPWPSDHPELYAHAPGYGALRIGHDDLLRELAARDGRVDVHLPRRAVIPIRVVGDGGGPISDRRVAQRGPSTWARSWLEQDGRTVLDVLFEDRTLQLVWADIPVRQPATGRHIIVTEPPSFGEVVLRPLGDAFERHGDGPTVPLTVRWETGGADRAEPALRAFHESGWVFTLRNGEVERIPPGRVRVVAGGPFRGWEERTRDLVLGPAPRELELELRPEIRLELSWPDKDLTWLHQQAGDQSVTHVASSPEKPEWITVPRDSEIVLLADFADGEVRRVRVGPLATDASVDLAAEATIVRPGLIEREESARLEVRVVDAGGSPLPAEIRIRGGDWAYRRDERGDWSPRYRSEAAVSRQDFALPARKPATLEVRAEGRRWLRKAITTPAEGTSTTEVVTLIRNAELVLEGDVVWVRLGDEEGPAGELRPRLLSNSNEARIYRPAPGTATPHGYLVSPGPLQVLVERHDGSLLGMELRMDEGERRIVSIPRASR